MFLFFSHVPSYFSFSHLPSSLRHLLTNPFYLRPFPSLPSFLPFTFIFFPHTFPISSSLYILLSILVLLVIPFLMLTPALLRTSLFCFPRHFIPLSLFLASYLHSFLPYVPLFPTFLLFRSIPTRPFPSITFPLP